MLIGRDKKGKRDLQDLNLRGYYPVDFTDSVNSAHISYVYLVFKFRVHRLNHSAKVALVGGFANRGAKLRIRTPRWRAYALVPANENLRYLFRYFLGGRCEIFLLNALCGKSRAFAAAGGIMSATGLALLQLLRCHN